MILDRSHRDINAIAYLLATAVYSEFAVGPAFAEAVAICPPFPDSASTGDRHQEEPHGKARRRPGGKARETLEGFLDSVIAERAQHRWPNPPIPESYRSHAMPCVACFRRSTAPSTCHIVPWFVLLSVAVRWSVLLAMAVRCPILLVVALQ